MTLKIKPFKYVNLIATRSVPEGYVCSDCDATNGRLFLMYENYVRQDRLKCAVCVDHLLGLERYTGATAAYPDESGRFFYTLNEHTRVASEWWQKLPLYAKPPATRLGRRFKKKLKKAIVYHHSVIYNAPNPVLTKDIRVKRSKYGLRFKWLKYQDNDVQTRDADERDRYGFAGGIIREVAYHKYAMRIRKYLRSIANLPPMAREYLPNLAGVPAETANPIVIEELSQAGIDIVDMPAMGEVKATKYGLLFVGNYTIAFHRNWVYWVAAVVDAPNKNQSPALSVTQARQLNDSPGTGDGTKYSGDLKKLGGVVRVDGFAGGFKTAEIDQPVSAWHIDSPAALVLFARWCRANLTNVLKENK